MKKTIILIFTLTLLSCSTKFIAPKLISFSQATSLVGKNIIYAYQQLQEEEMKLRVEDAIKLDAIKPSDLEPKVLTFQHLETRKLLIEYLVKYSELLLSVFEANYENDIQKNADLVFKNLEVINENHNYFLTSKEIGVMSTIAQAVPEAMTTIRKRAFVLKIMKDSQVILEKVTQKLKAEMESTKIMINNIYSRQFQTMVSEPWPKKESKRLKYSKLGLKIVEKKMKINFIIDDLIKAIDVLPKAHKEIRATLKKHDNPVKALSDLIYYAYKVKWSYDYFKNKGER